MIDLPESLSAAIAALGAASPPGLDRAVRRLSERYRSGLSTDDLEDTDALAYVLYRMPATYAACASALSATAVALPEFSPVSLIDFGAGPGTAAWAAARAFPSIREVTFVERNAAMRRAGETLTAQDPLLASATWAAQSAGEADLVVASYALGESPAHSDAMWDAARHALVVIEPGTPRGYRTVIEARSMGISRGGHVAAPCPHDAACPMTRTSDWCHFSQRLSRSASHRVLKKASLPWEDEKFSYVAIARAQPARASSRIVGRPRFAKHLVRLPLCTRDDGLVDRKVGGSDPAYRAARDARWGDAFG